MKRLQKQLEKVLLEEAEARKRAQKLKNQIRAAAKKRTVKKCGRPRISNELLLQIKIDAVKNSLTFAAWKNNVSVNTLYNYGITRKSIDATIAEILELVEDSEK